MDEVRRLAHEHKPKLIIAGATAYPRHWDFAAFREIADEVGAYLLVDMSHFSGPRRRRRAPLARSRMRMSSPRTTHKSLRGPRSGMILWNDEELSKPLNMAVFPGMQGGPLMHVIAAKAVAFGEALRPEFRTYAARVVENAKALAASLEEAGLRDRLGRDRQPPDAGRPHAQGRDRQGRRKGPRSRLPDLQQERHSVRHRAARSSPRASAWARRRARRADSARPSSAKSAD